MQAAMDRFNSEGRPTAADSTALRQWADSLQAIGQSTWGRNPKRARDYHQWALRAYRVLADSGRVAEAIGDVGVTYYYQSRYERALNHFKRSLTIHRDLGDRKEMASALNNLGVIRKEQGEYEKALARYRASVEIDRNLGNRAGVASSLTNIGLVYQREGRDEEALAHFREAIQIDRELDNREGLASNLHNIGLIRQKQGEYEKALARHRSSLQIERKMNNREGIASTLNNLGVIWKNLGEYEKALDRSREALQINRAVGDRASVILNLVNVGQVHLESGRLAAASDTLGRAVRHAEKLRLSVTSPGARRSLLSTQIQAYRGLSVAHLRSGRPDAALRTVEQARARLLADRLAGTAVGDTAFALPSVPEFRRTLAADEAALLYTGVGSESPLTALVVTQDTVHARELPDSTFLAAVKNKYATHLNRLRRERGPLTAALGENTAPGEPSMPSLAEIIRFYRYYLTRDQADTSIQNELSRRLYDLLVEPIAPVTADKRTLVAVPTGALGYLPFETVRDSTGTYLAEKKHVRYAQSLTVLRQLQGRDYSGREQSLLAFGGAVYEPNSKSGSSTLIAEARRGSTRAATPDHASTLLRDASRRMEQGKSPRRVYRKLGYAWWGNLPGTEREAQQLGQIAGGTATVLTGEMASERTVRSINERGELGEYERLHFATHGVAIPETPELSALVLSQAKASDSLAAKDGYLTMEEIADLEMRADVAVLSACQTGLGKVVAGEGVVSLSHAFLRAGANATLVSQWKVLDESTRRFMTSVYERAEAEQTSFAEAVTETKRAFIEGEYGAKNTDPLRWAPFVYYGRE